MGIAEDIVLIILFGLGTGFISHKLKIPMFLGYIVAGIIIGPHTGGITVSNVYQVGLLAEIGVALLLFSIGLDLSLKELLEVKNIALYGTLVQVLLTVLYGTLIGFAFGFDPVSSIVIGVVISLSSTMVVLKILMNRGLLGTLSSKVMIGMLIVQDLAAIPMMIIIPKINQLTTNVGVLGFTFLKAALFLILLILLGRKVIPALLKTIARLNSQELFLLTITAIGLGVGYLAHYAGLSFAFGAFVAGMVLNESEYSHQALSDIIPLRDVFGLIFFVSIGMLFDPVASGKHILVILSLVALVTVGKFIIFSVISRAFGYFNIIPLAVGMGLAQIGEFSFLIATLSLKERIINQDLYAILLSTIVLTMLISPFLSMLSPLIYARVKKKPGRDAVRVENSGAAPVRDHVVIAGGGRVGQTVAATLADLGYSFVIIEQDFHYFEQVKGKGYPVIYGDACQESVLVAAQVRSARLLLITIPVLIVARKIILLTKSIRPDLDIIARAESPELLEELYKLDVHELVQPEFEASLEILRQSLLHLEMPVAAIQQYIGDMRRKRYSPLLRENHDYRLLSGLQNASILFQMQWIMVDPGSRAIGKSIQELKIRTLTGASIVGIYRGDAFLPTPAPDTILHGCDYLAIMGPAECQETFESYINQNQTLSGPPQEGATHDSLS